MHKKKYDVLKKDKTCLFELTVITLLDLARNMNIYFDSKNTQSRPLFNIDTTVTANMDSLS